MLSSLGKNAGLVEWGERCAPLRRRMVLVCLPETLRRLSSSREEELSACFALYPLSVTFLRLPPRFGSSWCENKSVFGLLIGIYVLATIPLASWTTTQLNPQSKCQRAKYNKLSTPPYNHISWSTIHNLQSPTSSVPRRPNPSCLLFIPPLPQLSHPPLNLLRHQPCTPPSTAKTIYEGISSSFCFVRCE